MLSISSVPNRGGLLLPIDGGDTARVSSSVGGRIGVVKHSPALMGWLVRVGCEDNSLTVFKFDRFLRCLVRALVSGIFMTNDGVIVVFPFLGCGRSGVTLFCSSSFVSSLRRLSCLLSFVDLCSASWICVSSSLVSEVSSFRSPVCKLPGRVSCNVIA